MLLLLQSAVDYHSKQQISIEYSNKLLYRVTVMRYSTVATVANNFQ